MRLRRQLSRLADRHEAGAELVRQRCAENEPAAFDADDVVDWLVPIGRSECADHVGEPLRVPKQRGDVVEQDAGLRKVRNMANLRAQMIHRFGRVGRVGRVSRVSRPTCSTLNSYSTRNMPPAPDGGTESISTDSTRACDGPRRSAISNRSSDS